MTDFTIRGINVASDEEMRQLNELDEACAQDIYGASQKSTVDERRAALAPSAYQETERFVAAVSEGDAERVVGIAICGMPLYENKKTAFIGLAVHPEYRGRGIGSALAERLKETAHAAGRTTLDSWGEIPADANADDSTLPVNLIARRLGMEKKNVAAQKTLDLPLPEGKLAQFEAQVAEKIGDYRLETWTDGIPENQLENYGILLRQLELDEPTGDHRNEAPEFSADRVREIREKQKAMGFRDVITVAFSPENEIAGQSEIIYNTNEGTSIGFQENTLVMPAHRGHALGLAMKVANHRKLEAVAPHIKVVVTGNSSLNTQMNAINEQFGYKVACQEIAFQS
ncbi:GNAT family N-acetyltransferase [Rothia amarae]|uniref:GNAT family N-acetyltransferase n=1 Tax=Rothia amarae TaxID=169480 RepID=UPI0012444243